MKKIFAYIPIAAVIFLCGCRWFKPIEPITTDGVALEKSGLVFNYDDEQKVLSLSKGDMTLLLPLNRRISRINGTKIWLFNPLQMDEDNVLRLTKNDVDKIVLPLLNRHYTLPRKAKKVVIDPGHGGKDPGAVSNNINEKDLNFSVAIKLKKALEAKGFEVLLSRNEDVYITLDERCKFAADNAADVFISIHHNASGGSKAANGIESYALEPYGFDKNDPPRPPAPGNAFDEENINLNSLIQSKIIAAVKANDRGIKFARYYVLVNAPCPAVLVECGFMTNADELKEICSESRQNKTAEAIAAAVEEFARTAIIKSAD